RVVSGEEVANLASTILAKFRKLAAESWLLTAARSSIISGIFTRRLVHKPYTDSKSAFVLYYAIMAQVLYLIYNLQLIELQLLIIPVLPNELYLKSGFTKFVVEPTF